MRSSCGEFHLFNFENGKEEVNKHLETCKAKQKQEKKTKKVSLMTLRKHAESIFWSTPSQFHRLPDKTSKEMLMILCSVFPHYMMFEFYKIDIYLL